MWSYKNKLFAHFIHHDQRKIEVNLFQLCKTSGSERSNTLNLQEAVQL